MAISPQMLPPSGPPATDGAAPTVPAVPRPGTPPAPTESGVSPAPEADLPQFDYDIQFPDAATRDVLGASLVRKIQHSLMQQQDRFDRIRQFRDQYAATSYPKDTPWENAASLNIPTTFSAVETMHADVVGAMSGTAPLFRVEAFESAQDTPVANRIERMLQWQMQEQIGIFTCWDELVKGALLDGVSIAMVDWQREQHRTRRPGVRKDEAGMPVLNPDGSPQRALVEETDWTVSQPRVTPIDVLDFVLYPTNAPSIARAIGAGHRVWLTKNDLKKGVRDELYDADQVARLLSGGADTPLKQNELHGGDDMADLRAGTENGEPMDNDDKPFEFFRVVWQYDEDGDEIDEDCVFLVEMSTGIIVSAQIYPYWHNRRNYVAFVPMPRKKSWMGIAVPEALESLHAEINAIRNQRVDAGTLYLSPMVAARRGLKTELKNVRWRPGGVIYTEDPRGDIVPISFQNVSQQAFAEEQSARENVEKALGINDYAMGSSPSRSRAVGEIKQVTAAGNKRADMLIARLHVANTEMAEQILGLNEQFLDAKTEFAITRGETRVFQTFDRNDLRTRVRIAAQGNSISSNKELRLQQGETLWQMKQNDPLMQSPSRAHAIDAYYLEGLGVINYEPYIGSEEEAKQTEEAQKNAPPQPPPVQMSGRLGEVESLTLALHEGQFTMEELEKTAQAYLQYKAGEAAIEHAKDAATTEHAAHTQTAHGILTAGVQQAMGQAGQPSPFPPSGGSASPVPPAGGAG